MTWRKKNNDKVFTKHHSNQQQNQMAWVVRHCSPNIVVHTVVDDDRHGHQPDTACFSDWCAPVDWRSVRLKDTD